jgi:hypothetical protein
MRRTVVLDNGAGCIKAAWASGDNAAPACVTPFPALTTQYSRHKSGSIVPNALMKNKNGRLVYVGGQIADNKNCAALYFKRPFEKVRHIRYCSAH